MVEIMAWIRNNVKVSAMVDENDAEMTKQGAEEVRDALIRILAEVSPDSKTKNTEEEVIEPKFEDAKEKPQFVLPDVVAVSPTPDLNVRWNHSGGSSVITLNSSYKRNFDLASSGSSPSVSVV